MGTNSCTAAQSNGEYFVTQILMFTVLEFKRLNKYRKNYFPHNMFLYAVHYAKDSFSPILKEKILQSTEAPNHLK
jgi:hypothetical protein